MEEREETLDGGGVGEEHRLGGGSTAGAGHVGLKPAGEPDGVLDRQLGKLQL